MNPSDLLDTATVLLTSSKGRPTGASLCRATSSAYYALFHCLARECANLLIGGGNAERSEAAWRQVYRALDHGPAKQRCKNTSVMRRFPREVEDFANAFVTMQEKRHRADYDPFSRFTKSEVSTDIALARLAIERFKSARAKDRRAFCAYVLLKERNI